MTARPSRQAQLATVANFPGNVPHLTQAPEKCNLGLSAARPLRKQRAGSVKPDEPTPPLPLALTSGGARMGESESKSLTSGWSPEPKPHDQHQADLQAEIRRKQELDLLTIRVQGPVRPKHRTRQPWQPTDRERAILNIPKKLALEKYCLALDTAGVPFPEKWQRQRKFAFHRDAWENGSKRLKGWIKSERRNVWARFERD